MGALPDTLAESSGIEITGPNSLYLHNDSGDLPRIFQTDSIGNLIRIINLFNAGAIDYEDITIDENGNMYIGDFGNNFNNRTDLKIYKIPDPDLIQGDSIAASIISFSYPDQTLFPPPPEEQNFDCESMFHLNGLLYIFSKNRGTSTFCRMYTLPDESGNYIATLVDSFDTGTWITSADLSPDEKSMVLLTENAIWLFKNYADDYFFQGEAIRISIESSQKEAIVFRNNHEVLITDEKYSGTGGNLYSADLSPWIRFPEIPGEPLIIVDPAGEGSFVVTTSGFREDFTVEAWNVAGQKIIEKNFEKNEVSNSFRIHALPGGIYFFRAKSSSQQAIVKKFLNSNP